MWKKFILTVLLTGAVSLCIHAQENTQDAPRVVYRPSEEAFKDESTALIFNSRIGGYNKFAVSNNINPVYGTTIRYQNEVACGDIYIYSLDTKGSPVTPEAAEKEFKAVKESIRTMPERCSLVKSVLLKKDFGLELPAGAYGQRFLIQSGDGEIKSLLILFLYKGKIIKIRASCPADDQQEIQEAVLFCKEILKLAAESARSGK